MTSGTQPADRDVRPASTRLEEIQRLVGIGHWEWHVPTNVVTWSDEQCAMWGVDPEGFEATYEIWLGSIHPDDREMVEGAVGAAFQNQTAWAFDHRVVRPDGSVLWTHCRGEADVRDGEVHRMVGVSMDITDRMATERYLREFVSSASHELRTPVTSIYQAIDLLRTGRAGERSDDLLEIIARQADRLRELTTDLLDLSALDEPGTTVMLEPVDVSAVADATAAGRTEDVEVDGPPGVIALGSVAALERVLVNLVENAFLHGAAPVRIEVTSDDSEVQISVHDHGGGVEPSLRAELFTPFVGSGAGSGLGLALVRKLVQSMAGTVGYAATEDGSTFTVRLGTP